MMFHPFKYLFAAAITVTATTPVLHAEELTLKPLEPIIAEFNKNDNPDISQLAYVSARGGALFLAMSGYIEENSRGEKDNALAKKLSEKADAYYKVAVILGSRSKKTKDATDGQMRILTETYVKMMVASKQLNNEIASPAITKDMDALKSIEPVILELAEEIKRQASETPTK
jgi:hypothetical protein